MGPMEPMGPIGRMGSIGPMEPMGPIGLMGPIGPCGPMARKGGSSLAMAEANLNLYAALSAEGHTN